MKPGETFNGRYLIIKEIGRGGMGLVYLAYDLLKERQVAFKVINPEISLSGAGESLRRRFEREVQAAAQLDHPHIVRIYEANLDLPRPYLAMEYLNGGNLSQRLTQPLPWPQALTLLRPLLDALAYAHRSLIFHRDLKPGNVMFTGDEAATLKLVDFGLAYQAGDTRLTATGHMIGTPAYMSPEQARAEMVDSRADIFSLGIILIEAISGRNPLQKGSFVSTLEEVISARPLDLSPLPEATPPAVLALLRRATAKNRAERYPDCQAMLADWLGCLGQSPSLSVTRATVPPSTPGPEIQTGGAIRLPQEIEAILRALFQEYPRIEVEAEFGRAFSGSRVFLVRPFDPQRKLLPAVAKVAPVGLVQQEWQAYDYWVKNTLVNVAHIEARPNLALETPWDGLRYRLFGGGLYGFQNLSDYCRHPETGLAELRRVLEDNLFKELYPQWWQHSRSERRQWQADYDDILPVNLVLTPAAPPPGSAAQPVEPERLPQPTLAVNTPVQLAGFVVTEIDYEPPTLTLNLPRAAAAGSSYRLRVRLEPADLAPYRVGHLLAVLPARVTDTRHHTLGQKAAQAFGQGVDLSGDRLILPGGLNLPNPLNHYQAILQTTRDMRVGTIHGDLNLENILVAENGQINLIDFATVRQGHILHDLLRLETDTLTKLIAPTLLQAHLPADVICVLYQQLHQSTEPEPPHPDLAKPLALLSAIRRMAVKCLLDPGDWREYYQGLVLYLLGGLKFVKTGEPSLTGQVLVLGAAAAVGLMNNEKLPLPPVRVTGGAEVVDSGKGEETMSDKKICPFCGEQIQATAKKCRFCGEFLEESIPETAPKNQNLSPSVGGHSIAGVHDLTNSPINLGGNLATSGGQIILGDQIVHAAPPKTPLTELIKRAKNSLGQANYKQAVELCEQVLAEEPEHPEANLLAAIALMHGRGADQIKDNTIARIENHLQAALDEPVTEATALAVLGIVKYDHYIANGLLAGKPSLKEIKERLQAAGGVEAVEARLLNLVKASSTARERLGLFSTE